MIWNHGKMILEALLLASQEPLSLKRAAEVIGLDEKDARILMEDLERDYAAPGRGLMIRELAGGYVLTTRPEAAEYVDRLLQPRSKGLSHAALETLAIIAYRQPITKAEIEAVRGVKVDRALETLMERRLVQDLGRKEAPGRPVLYGTTADFLKYFGLKDIRELPPLAVDTSQAGLILPTRSGEEVQEAEVSATIEVSEAGGRLEASVEGSWAHEPGAIPEASVGTSATQESEGAPEVAQKPGQSLQPEGTSTAQGVPSKGSQVGEG